MSNNFSNNFRKHMKRVALAVGAAFMTGSLVAAAPMIETQLNGRNLTFDQNPVLEEGRVLVPLRGIFENLGADVLYDPQTKQIKATRDGKVVELTLGERQAFVNGQQVYLDVPADTIAGRTMVPLRFVSEAMGADVKWRSATRTVAISTDTTVGDNNQNQDQNQQPVADRPDIDQVIHSARSDLNLGDTLTVTMTGDADAQARFSILGSINDIQMREVSPGRYEGSLRITNGMDVNNATLVGYLEKDNMEAVMEASRGVTIATNPNNTSPNQGVTSIQPAAGTYVSTNRPTLRADFPSEIRPGSATITLNGRDFQPNVSNNNRSVSFTPSYNLGAGNQTVIAQALDDNGRLMKREWNFRVDSAAVNNPNQAANPTVSVTNLSNGSSVPPVFNIIGQTQPYTKVNIDATSQRNLIPGVVGIRGRTMQRSTVANAQGQFNVQLDTSNLPSDSQLDLEISVLESNGSVSDSVNLNLVRR